MPYIHHSITFRVLNLLEMRSQPCDPPGPGSLLVRTGSVDRVTAPASREPVGAAGCLPLARAGRASAARGTAGPALCSALFLADAPEFREPEKYDIMDPSAPSDTPNKAAERV